ncbi:MAG: hypothetical protein K6U12_13330 [Armatimonadetes bacterium]|nr:hypothetical protein [Armatimonadota bacterium]
MQIDYFLSFGQGCRVRTQDGVAGVAVEYAYSGDTLIAERRGNEWVPMVYGLNLVDGRLIEWWDTTCPGEQLRDLVRELDNFYPPLLLIGKSGTSGEAFLERVRSKNAALSADIMVVGVYDGESYLVYRTIEHSQIEVNNDAGQAVPEMATVGLSDSGSGATG